MWTDGKSGIEGLVSLVDRSWGWKGSSKLTYYRDWVLMSSRLIDVEVDRYCIQQTCGSSWWELLAGSQPFFWR